MIILKPRFAIPISLLVSFLTLQSQPLPCFGRDNSLSTGIGLLEEYDSNISRAAENHLSQWTATISPSLSFSSRGRNDSLSFSYMPGIHMVTGDSRTESTAFEDEEWHQTLLLDGQKALSKNLTMSARESLNISDDPTERVIFLVDPETETTFTEEQERRLTTTNSASLSATYSYGLGSSLTVGYINNYLKYDEPSTGGYKRHHSSVTSRHRFNTRWATETGYSYVRGNFNDDENLITRSPSLRIDFSPTPRSTLFSSYTMSRFDYEDLGEDYEVHDGRLGWRQSLSPHSSFLLSLGPSHATIGDQEDSLGFDASLSSQDKSTTYALGGSGGYAQQYYDASDDGLSRYWQANGNVRFQLTKNLAMDITGSFRNDDFQEVLGNEEQQTAITTLGLSHAITRWTTLSIRYRYLSIRSETDTDGAITENDYDVHRLFLELTATRELWRW